MNDRKSKSVWLAVATCLVAALVGCGDPKLHPISGRVTLDGKPYERLLVYMRPMERDATKFNIGVGETDSRGQLTLRSTAGDGLEQGLYRVSFSCMVSSKAGQEVLSGSEKHDDDRTLVTEEKVPEPYSSDIDSPEVFEVKANANNYYQFDIPNR